MSMKWALSAHFFSQIFIPYQNGDKPEVFQYFILFESFSC